MHIIMMIQLTMVRPKVFKDYILGEGKNKEFVENDVKNVWIAVYIFTGVVFIYVFQNNQFKRSKKIKKWY